MNVIGFVMIEKIEFKAKRRSKACNGFSMLTGIISEKDQQSYLSQFSPLMTLQTLMNSQMYQFK